jgi:rRNA maturation RNase YbeY
MIQFNKEEVKFKLTKIRELKKWISTIIEKSGKKTGDISFIFCKDEYLLEINQKYLKHNTLTDIITFDYSKGNVISGDIFISIDRVKENATKYATLFRVELGRVMVHGVLHLLGITDKSIVEKEKMRKLEDRYLSDYPGES